MSEVLNFLIVTKQGHKSDIKFLQSLGLNNCTKGRFTVDGINGTSKESNRIFIGSYKDVKVVSNLHIVSSVFQNEILFPKSDIIEIAAFLIDNRGNRCGFCLYQAGTLIRKLLYDDGNLICDYGDLIPEEIELRHGQLSLRYRKEFSYYDIDFDTEIVWHIVSLLSQRYLDYPYDNPNAPRIKFDEYLVSNT